MFLLCIFTASAGAACPEGAGSTPARLLPPTAPTRGPARTLGVIRPLKKRQTMCREAPQESSLMGTRNVVEGDATQKCMS